MNERPVLSLEELEAFDPHAPQGQRRRFCCPLCGGGKARDGAHRCLSVDSQSGLWKCFRCEAGGQLREKWEGSSPLGRGRARQALSQAFSLPSPVLRVSMASDVSKSRDLSQEAPQVPEGAWQTTLGKLQPLQGSAGQAYLEGRGLSLEVSLKAKVRFCPSWLGRPAVVFPIYDDQGVLVAAQGRYTDGRVDPKARTLGPKKSGVFLSGGFWEHVKRGAPLTITEAPIDALSIAMCGFPAMALCGKSGWPSWLPVRCAFKEVAVAFDADEAGEGGAGQLRPVLESLGARVQRLSPEGETVKDWNEMLQAMGAKELTDWLCLRLLGGAENGSA